MSEAKFGDEFIKHEFDEAISIQSVIVKTGTALATKHPEAAARRLIKGMGRTDQQHLEELRRLGKPYGATGKVEDVSKALGDLARETTAAAGEAASDAYEAHAVLLTLKRKQQDSAAAVVKIARALKDTAMRDSARAMLRDTKLASKALADGLADFAVVIATRTSGTSSAKA